MTLRPKESTAEWQARCAALWAERVLEELGRARKKFPRMQSGPHEGFAVLLEEGVELFQAIMANNLVGAQLEAVQVAAMAIRFLVDGYGFEGTSRRRLEPGTEGACLNCGVSVVTAAQFEALQKDRDQWKELYTGLAGALTNEQEGDGGL